MKRHKTYCLLFLLGFLSLLISCDIEESSLEGMDFGESVYYDSFLWVDSSTVTLTKELKFEFSDYAIEQEAYLELQFVDANNEKLDINTVNIYVDGQPADNGIITIYAVQKIVSKKIGVQFLPNCSSGKQNGYITVISHKFDRIDNIDSDDLGSDKRIKRWTAYYEKDLNPLALVLSWFVIIILATLLFWFLMLRNMIHPKFKKGNIQILTPYFGGVTFSRNIKLVIFTNTIQKQNIFNKIFTGKIQYEINSIYDKPIILRPGRGNKIKIKLPIGASLTPPVIHLEKFKTYSININNQVVEIQYS